MANPEPLKTSKKFNALQIVFAITAFVLMWIGTLRCGFVKFTSTSGTSEPISLQFGIWYYQFFSVVFTVDGAFAFESCHGYPDWVSLDGSWKAARAFSVLTFIFSIIVLVTACVSACAIAGTGRITFAWEAPVFLMVALFQGLTLLLLNSNVCKNNLLIQDVTTKYPDIGFPDTCSLDTGAKLSISAMVFFFVASVSAFLAHKAENEEIKAEGESGLTEP
eukprot:CAMPEP_0183707732 /NCGR_PEP_ID=MMETSP0737-20130205/4225_1 /TAXON_ID=385413 /ORGANISM="Thalassiosira miniscula, Strain CCMP1093" /LENGTH=219 /DNA_ID=CAMNT_0025935461 /DNA_START=146 /DNA_END=802 /DNA_ORIENTATION=-